MNTTAHRHDPLAIDGGPKVRTTPPPPRRLFGHDVREAVMQLMDQAQTEGDYVLGYGGREERAYCHAFCEMMGGGFADGVNSGTNAVYVALAALELEPLSEVVVPPITDPGGVMPVGMVGCVSVAADAAPGSFNTDAEQIERVLTDRTRALLVAHVAGVSVDMDPVIELARSHDLWIVEDCAQAHGARYKGRPVGTLGAIAAFSTMLGKHHATGGQGGLVYTRDEALHTRARRYADRGKPIGLEDQNQNVVRALNCNMDELHATIGRATLARLPELVACRRRVAERVAEGCTALETASLETGHAHDEPSYWFLIVKLRLDRLTADRDGIVQALKAEGIDCSGYANFPTRMPWANDRCPACGRQTRMGCELIDCCRKRWTMPELPNARSAEAACLRIPIHDGWREADADDVVAALAKIEFAYRKP